MCECVCEECQGSRSAQVLKHVHPSGNFIERLSASVGQTPRKCQWPCVNETYCFSFGLKKDGVLQQIVCVNLNMEEMK